MHPIKPAQISSACLVADVLGPEVRTHYISRYVSLELKEYRRIFRATDEAGGLDNISRRFAWFRRLLLGHETEAGRVFPSEWRVGWELFAKFAEITRRVGWIVVYRGSKLILRFRDDMSTLLSKAGSSLTVKALLEALQQTTEFEMSIAKKWATPVSTICLVFVVQPLNCMLNIARSAKYLKLLWRHPHDQVKPLHQPSSPTWVFLLMRRISA